MASVGSHNSLVHRRPALPPAANLPRSLAPPAWLSSPRSTTRARPFLLAILFLAACLPALALADNPGFHAVYSRDGIDAWAVGDLGAYYRSLDGGLSWSVGTLGSVRLRDLAANGYTVMAVGDSGRIWRSMDSGGTWSLTVEAGTPELRSIAMPSSSVAYVTGAAGTILKSSDGGATWTPQTSGTSSRLNAVAFEDDQHGWAVGESGTALSTTDGGDTWTPVAVGTTRALYSVMQRGARVWTVGAWGTALKSVNGGASFTPVNLKLDAHSDVRAVWLESADSVFIAGGGGFIRRSADDGATWFYPVHSMHGQISDLMFANGTGFAVSNKNQMPMSSIDRGTTWRFPTGGTLARGWISKLTDSDVYGNTMAPNPLDPSVVYCAINHTVYRSGDEGDTWAPISTIPGGIDQINAFIVSPRDTNVFIAAVGIPMQVIKSDDRGQNWHMTLEHDYGFYGVPLEYDHDHPDTLYFGGDTDVLYRSLDRGEHWAAWSITSFRSPCDILVVPDSSNIILIGDGETSSGRGKYWKSVDWGHNFTLMATQPMGCSEIPEMSTSRLRNNVVFGTNWAHGGVQKSTDFGQTWPILVNTAFAWGTDIARDDPNVVMFGSYSSGDQYLSVDGGTTFTSTTLISANYSFYARDRGLMLIEMVDGVSKMVFFYNYTPQNAQSVTVASPNGGEVWTLGTVHDVTWTAQHLALAVIEVRHAPGEPWQTIDTVPGYQGHYAWTVPDMLGDQVKVRVRDAWDAAPVDSSNAVFTIQGYVAGVGSNAGVGFALQQNRPNPFTRTTRIEYRLPVATDVELAVYDLQGHRVATLAHERQLPGEHSAEFGAAAVTASSGRRTALHAGVYYVRLTAGSFSAVRKMLYLE